MISKEIVMEFLLRNKLSTRATITKEVKPEADTIYYFIEPNFDIFFLTNSGTQKYKNIQYQDDVCMVVTDAEKKITAKIKGKAALVLDKDFPKKILEKIAQMANTGDKFDTVYPILKRNDGALVVMKIIPFEIRYSDYGGDGIEEGTVTF